MLIFKRVRTGTAAVLPLLLVGATVGLSGCASIPKQVGSADSGAKLKQQVEKNADWQTTPFKQEYGAPAVLLTPETLPADLADKKIDLSLSPNATFSDLTFALGQLHLSVLIADAKIASSPVGIPYFKGTVGQLLKAVSRLTNVFFVWDGSALVVVKTAHFTASVPQVKNLVAKVQTVLSAIGAQKVSSVQQAGTVYFTATPAVLPQIKAYLASLNRDAALISIRVAVLNVQLTNAQNTGVDWGALEAAAGTAALGSPLATLLSGIPSGNSGGNSFSSPSSGSNGGNAGQPYGSQPYGSQPYGSQPYGSQPYGAQPYGSQPYGGSTGGPGGPSASITPQGATIAMSGSGAQLTFNAPSFQFSGILQFLDTYGKTSTIQNSLVRTLGGTPVALQSGTQVPYVANVGVGGVGGGGAGYGSTVGMASTSSANSGLKLKLEPNYNYRTGLVTITVQISVDSVLGFNQLSAGSQLGTLTQPTTQKESLNSVVQLLPGQTSIIGGLRYKTIGNNKQGLPWLANHGLASKDYQLSDEEMVIILRPTITVYDKKIPDGLAAIPERVHGESMLQLDHD